MGLGLQIKSKRVRTINCARPNLKTNSLRVIPYGGSLRFHGVECVWSFRSDFSGNPRGHDFKRTMVMCDMEALNLWANNNIQLLKNKMSRVGLKPEPLHLVTKHALDRACWLQLVIITCIKENILCSLPWFLLLRRPGRLLWLGFFF